MDTLLTCTKFKVVARDVPAFGGGTRRREFVVHPGAVVILPILADGRIVLCHVWREVAGRELLELPAGTLDRPGEAPEAAALRELEEETGFCAGRIRLLAEFYTSPGIMTETMRAYVAEDLSPGPQRLEETERIRVEVRSPAQAMDAIDRGEIVDAKTLVTLLRWDRLVRQRP